MPFEPPVRRSLRSYAPYRAATPLAEVRARSGVAEPIKLSQNENPLGSSPRALAALRATTDGSRYVEDDHLALRTRLAERYALSPENVVLGHGSNELVQLAFVTFVEPGDEVVMANPTFSLFRKFAEIFAARAVEVPLREGLHDLAALRAAVGARTKLVFVCDPNNPTGTRLDPAQFARFAAALPENVLLVVDQAYLEYAGSDACNGTSLLAAHPASLVLRTASKIFGLAALRFGYGYADAATIAWMNRARVPYNVSGPTAAAVLAALDDEPFIARSLAQNARGRELLAGGAAALGLHVYPSAANFVAVAVPGEADEVFDGLLARGVVVRSGEGLAMPGRLRVSVGTDEQNAAFLEALAVVLVERAAPVSAAG
ncbi:MAG: histidinol-phosphate transaminase [Vulcanimicrobiaceae bacterium]